MGGAYGCVTTEECRPWVEPMGVSQLKGVNSGWSLWVQHTYVCVYMVSRVFRVACNVRTYVHVRLYIHTYAGNNMPLRGDHAFVWTYYILYMYKITKINTVEPLYKGHIGTS